MRWRTTIMEETFAQLRQFQQAHPENPTIAFRMHN